MRRAVITILFIASPLLPVAAQTTKPASKDYPAAVAAALQRAYPNATVTSTSKEVEDGKTTYEIETNDRGTRRDLVYLADGTLLVEEEVIAVDGVPAPVVAAVKVRYKTATILLSEKVTTKGVVTYELQVTNAPVKIVELKPDGTWITPKPAVKK